MPKILVGLSSAVFILAAYVGHAYVLTPCAEFGLGCVILAYVALCAILLA